MRRTMAKMLGGLTAAASAAAAPADATVIRAGTLHVGTGERITDAVVIVEGGEVRAVGSGLRAPDGAAVIELDEGHITPGLIDANTLIEPDDLFEPARPRVAGGDLAPLLSRLEPTANFDQAEDDARRGIERFGSTGACACAACAGFAACPLAAKHRDFMNQADPGCPCCGFPAKGPMHRFVSGVRPTPFRVEATSEVVPHTRVIDGVSLRSKDFERLARGGVTTVFLAPDSSAVIGPAGAIVHTAGPMADRVVNAEAAVQAALGSDPYALGLPNMMPFGGFVTTRTRRPTTRMGVAFVFRKAFYDSMRLEQGLEITGADRAPAPALRVLTRVRRGDVPLRIHARDGNDIELAFDYADELGLSPIIVEAAEAHLVADLLAARGAPVVLGPMPPERLGMRRFSGDKMRMKKVTARALFDAGLEPAISAQDMREEDGLARQAMLAIGQGLTFDEALRAVTVNPARILGVDDVAGTLEAGKRADLIVWSGEPFAATSRPAVVMAGGRVVRNDLERN